MINALQLFHIINKRVWMLISLLIIIQNVFIFQLIIDYILFFSEQNKIYMFLQKFSKSINI